jgi:DNA-binding winged helix-turn-helix (wHTH) protein/tetratricopeptide (TPR) repeat protein
VNALDKIVGDLLLRPEMLRKRPEMAVGAARLHPAMRSLAGPDGQTTLEPRVMQLLIALADADGEVVTREEIEARCWGVVVSDDSINQLVAKLRRAAETAGGFRIETIPRTGYRLVTETMSAPAPSPGPASVLSGGIDAPGLSTRRVLLAGAGAALAVGAGALIYGTTRPDPAQRLADQLVAEADQMLALDSPDKEKEGLALLERAANLQPDRAELWGKLALERARAQERAAPDTTVPPAVRVLDPARRALILEPTNIDAKAAIAILPPYYGDWLAAERRFDAVLREKPDHLAVQQARSFLYGAVGRMREGAMARLGFADRVRLDAAEQARVGYSYWFLGRVPEADQALARAAELWPANRSVWMFRFFIFAGTGRPERALAQVEDPVGRPNLPPPMLESFRLVAQAAISGAPADRDKAASAVTQGIAKSPAAVINALMLLNIIGAVDTGFDVAHAYFLERGPLIAALRWRPDGEVHMDQRRRKTNPLFVPSSAPMRADPRFEPLVRDMGLDRYWTERGIQPDYRRA